jgi:hypothetical protein
MTPHVRSRLAILAGLAALAVSACNQTSTPDQTAFASPGVTPTGFRMPDGTGCSGEIARYRAVMGNDVQIGHVNRSVYDKITAEVDRAAAACAAGRDAEAVRMVAATKSRYGYR